MKYRLLGSAAAAVALLASAPGNAQVVAFGTLQPGAINNIFAQIVSKVVQQNSKLQMRVLPMRSGDAQYSAVQARRSEFAIGDINDITAALLGKHAYKGRAKPNLRLAFNMIAFPVGVMVRKDSGIRSLKDLKGKRFPVGWNAFPNGVPLTEGTLATVGMTFNDVKGVPTSGLIPAANDFKAGKLDATMFAVGAPKVAEVNAAVGGIRFLPIATTPDAVKKMKAVRDDYYPLTLKPAKPLVGILEPTALLTFDNVIATGTHVKDEIVYQFVKAVHENKAALAKNHPAFRRFSPARMGKQFSAMNYHPGAIKFYKEKGIWQGK